MNRISNIIILMISITVCIHTGEAFQCYFCNSNTDPTCGDPFFGNYTYSQSQRVHCQESMSENYNRDSFNTYNHHTGLKPVCRKIVYRKSAHSQETFVSRTCVPTIKGYQQENINYCDPLHMKNEYAIVEFCETCQYELCNSAMLPLPSYGVAISSIASSLMAVLLPKYK